MPDRLTLSCWVHGYHPLNVLHHWEGLLRLFPYSTLSERILLARVHAVSFSEPVLDEYALEPPADPDSIIGLAREHQNDDCAYELECAWDLVQLDQDWRLAPAPVRLWCFGTGFENDTGDHLRIEFGQEDLFLPSANDSRGVRAAQANLKSLMRLVKETEAGIRLEKKLLWSESGINFAEKLERMVAGGPERSTRH